MTTVTFSSSTLQETYFKAPAQMAGFPAGAVSGGGPRASDGPASAVQLSHAALREVALTGRVAINR